MHRPRHLDRSKLAVGPRHVGRSGGRGLACGVSVVMVVVPTILSRPPSVGATSATAVTISITETACAPAWTAPRAGRRTFVIDNRTAKSGAIYLYNPHTGVTVGRRTGLGPKSSVTMRVDLKPGTYTWGCHLQGAPTHQSTDVVVRPIPVMTAAGPTTEIPVSAAQLAGPLQSYRTYVSTQLASLVTQVGALRTALSGGNLSQAENAWLTAHLTWQRVGAAYDAFGTLGTKINGLATGEHVGQTPGSVGTKFEGFHKIELDLWGQGDLAQAGADADQLAANLTTLVARFARDSIPPAELPLRTHEILEDSQRDELSGDDDYGSGTDMASVESDVSGTEVLLQLLAPVLKERAPDLVSRALVQLHRLDAALSATQVAGHWVPVEQVPLAQREQVAGAIGSALEILAIVPDVVPVMGSTL
jgi:high-affinity iron transporter